MKSKQVLLPMSIIQKNAWWTVQEIKKIYIILARKNYITLFFWPSPWDLMNVRFCNQKQVFISYILDFFFLAFFPLCEIQSLFKCLKKSFEVNNVLLISCYFRNIEHSQLEQGFYSVSQTLFFFLQRI